jgi:ASC-1-like (ASCH) protein
MADEERTVLVEVIDIFTAPSFADLEQKLIETGLLARGAFSLSGMRQYYSAEDEEKYGVMGIKISVINSTD